MWESSQQRYVADQIRSQGGSVSFVWEGPEWALAVASPTYRGRPFMSGLQLSRRASWVNQMLAKCGSERFLDTFLRPKSATIRAPASMCFMESLQSLQDVSIRKISPTSHEWAALKRMRNVESLDLSESNADDSVVEGMYECRELRRLILRQTKVTSRSMDVIAGLPNLEYLDICATAVDDTGLEYLTKCRRLQILMLSLCAISDISADRFVLNHPDVTVIRDKFIVD